MNSRPWQPPLFRIKHLMCVSQPACEPPVPQVWKSMPSPPPRVVTQSPSLRQIMLCELRGEKAYCDEVLPAQMPRSLAFQHSMDVSRNTSSPGASQTTEDLRLNAGKVAKNRQTLNCAHIHFKRALPAYKQSPVPVGWKSTE